MSDETAKGLIESIKAKAHGDSEFESQLRGFELDLDRGTMMVQTRVRQESVSR